MSDRFVVVGAGPVGSETAELLRDRGHDVTVVTRSGTRSGTKASPHGVRSVAADASDPERLTELVTGAAAVFNCANPSSYTVWEQVWPPLSASLLETAERTGATLVTASSLYAYGPVSAPMVEGQPDLAVDHKGRLRADMWAEARRRHEAQRIQAVEVRASDYAGAGVGANGHLTRQVGRAAAGHTAWVLGSPDLPHTWTDVRDVARALVEVAGRPDTWGRVWHAPSNPPRSQRDALTDVLASIDRPPVPVRGYPRLVSALGARLSPMMRELAEMSYIFDRPYVMDATATSQALGLAPTPWSVVCRRTATGN